MTVSSSSFASPSHLDLSSPDSLRTAEAALMRVAQRPERVMVRGSGSYLWDHLGTRYLDFVQGWAVNSLGHCPPEITRALHTQSETLLSASPAFHNAPQLRFAHKLTRAAGMAHVHFANSGAEANEAAIKLARKWGKTERRGAHRVITTVGSFHGRTLAMMAASGKPGWDDLFPPIMPGFDKVPFGDSAAVRAAITSSTVAIMVEPIQGEAGVVVPPDGYLRELRGICDTHGLLLVCDEVQTGMGRTGSLFACQREDVKPDILTLGKGLGGGVPISAVLANERASCFVPGDQGGTYNGNPLMTSVAEAVFDVVSQEAFLARVREVGIYLAERLSASCAERGLGLRGRGLLWALTLDSDRAERVVAACFSAGLLINAPRPSLLRLMPSLRVTIEEVDEMVSVLTRALDA